MSIAKMNESIFDIVKKIVLSPYRFAYFRNTKDPIDAVLSPTTDIEDCKTKLERFFHLKLREVQYVQIAVSSGNIDFWSLFSLRFIGPPITPLFPSTHTWILSNGPQIRVQYSLPLPSLHYHGQRRIIATGPVLRSGMQLCFSHWRASS